MLFTLDQSGSTALLLPPLLTLSYLSPPLLTLSHLPLPLPLPLLFTLPPPPLPSLSPLPSPLSPPSDHCQLHHFLHEFVEQHFLDNVRLECAEKLNNCTKRKPLASLCHFPINHPSHLAHLHPSHIHTPPLPHISAAEVAKTVASDQRTLKMTGSKQTVFNVRTCTSHTHTTPTHVHTHTYHTISTHTHPPLTHTHHFI